MSDVNRALVVSRSTLPLRIAVECDVRHDQEHRLDVLMRWDEKLDTFVVNAARLAERVANVEEALRSSLVVPSFREFLLPPRVIASLERQAQTITCLQWARGARYGKLAVYAEVPPAE